jgi:hypothetical protein
MDAITILIQENGRACVIRNGENVTSKLEHFCVTLQADERGDFRASCVTSHDLVPREPLSAPPLPTTKDAITRALRDDYLDGPPDGDEP